MKKFDIHLVIGNTKIVLKGAEELSITESLTPPQLTAKAPTGGKTTYTLYMPDGQPRAGVTIHEIEQGGIEEAGD